MAKITITYVVRRANGFNLCQALTPLEVSPQIAEEIIKDSNKVGIDPTNLFLFANNAGEAKNMREKILRMEERAFNFKENDPFLIFLRRMRHGKEYVYSKKVCGSTYLLSHLSASHHSGPFVELFEMSSLLLKIEADGPDVEKDLKLFEKNRKKFRVVSKRRVIYGSDENAIEFYVSRAIFGPVDGGVKAASYWSGESYVKLKNIESFTNQNGFTLFTKDRKYTHSLDLVDRGTLMTLYVTDQFDREWAIVCDRTNRFPPNNHAPREF